MIVINGDVCQLPTQVLCTAYLNYIQLLQIHGILRILNRSQVPYSMSPREELIPNTSSASICSSMGLVGLRRKDSRLIYSRNNTIKVHLKCYTQSVFGFGIMTNRPWWRRKEWVNNHLSFRCFHLQWPMDTVPHSFRNHFCPFRIWDRKFHCQRTSIAIGMASSSLHGCWWLDSVT